MAYTSPSGPATQLKLTLNGSGADPASMPCSPGAQSSSGNNPTNTTASTVPDTGFFSSSEPGTVSSFLIGGSIILALVALATVSLFVYRSKTRLNFAKSFKIRNPKLVLKNLGIFTGFFIFAFLAIGAIMPNVLESTEGDASALETANALAITTGSSTNNHILAMSYSFSSVSGVAFGMESVTVNAATQSGYTLYLSTDNDRPNYLYRNNETCGGYIAPTAGTVNNKTRLEANHWGFAVDATNATVMSNSAIWAAVPSYGNEVAIKRASTATPAEDTTNVFYGAFVSNSIPAGDYFNSVIYTAIANLSNPSARTTSAEAQATPEPSQEPIIVTSTPEQLESEFRAGEVIVENINEEN